MAEGEMFQWRGNRIYFSKQIMGDSRTEGSAEWLEDRIKSEYEEGLLIVKTFLKVIWKPTL